MEDHRLKAFCLIVELRSFSNAAKAKFMTQSAMSHLIKNLEGELGTKLLIRKGKTVVPTPAGKIFYEHARQILEQYKKLENTIYASMKKIKGPLSIGASMTAASYLLPQLLYSFSKTYPEVQISLSVSNTEGIVNDLQRGTVDLGFVEGTIQNANVHLEEIAEDEIVIIASDDNPLTKKDSLTVHEILTQPFILPETGSGIREFIENFFKTSKIDIKNMKVLMTLGDPELIVQMVQSGLGISFVSKWSIFKPIKEGTIRILKLPGKSLYRKFYIVSLYKEPSTMVVKTFRKFTKEYRFFIPF